MRWTDEREREEEEELGLESSEAGAALSCCGSDLWCGLRLGSEWIPPPRCFDARS